ncbi:hypothetical protein ECC02_011504 [Trypanosoma cruzi]|uniref:Uncharacterized protein n=1 Tax=Trypanosoma cruzi TaxID=5693 RepID=A0A7J6XNG6_TRYCR|nr:hypothetical protein ECC02_011504 [Trypanosoma cruzi]
MESNRGDERCGRHTQRAHHMRRGQQPGMHRAPHTTHDTHSNPRQQAHTHTALPQHQHTNGKGRSKQERHTRLHRMHIRRERSVVSAPLTEGTHTHKRRRSAHSNPKNQSNYKKREIPAHHVDCWSTGSAANIHHKINSVAFGLRSYSAHTTSCRHGHRSSSSRTRKNARRKWNKASNHLFVFLFECWQMSACVVLFLRRANLHAWVVCWGFLQGAQLCFSSCECFLCWCGQEFGLCCSCLLLVKCCNRCLFFLSLLWHLIPHRLLRWK